MGIDVFKENRKTICQKNQADPYQEEPA